MILINPCGMDDSVATDEQKKIMQEHLHATDDHHKALSVLTVLSFFTQFKDSNQNDPVDTQP
jgi:hypothetical protein